MDTVGLWSSCVLPPPLFHSCLCHFILLVRIECRDSGNSLFLWTGPRWCCVSLFFKLDIILRIASKSVSQPGTVLGPGPSAEGSFFLVAFMAFFGKKRCYIFFFMQRTRTGPMQSSRRENTKNKNGICFGSSFCLLGTCYSLLPHFPLKNREGGGAAPVREGLQRTSALK